jgi:hypothetical protein
MIFLENSGIFYYCLQRVFKFMLVKQYAVKNLKSEHLKKITMQHKKISLITDMFDEKQTFMASVELYF